MMRLTPLLLLGVSLSLAAQRPAKSAAPGKYPAAPAAAMAAIKEADLKRDLYAMAGDAMRGREAGSLDEMRASIWVAEQLRTIGVKPAGDDGTYFQWWNMRRTRVSTAASSVKSGGKTLELWKDVVPTGNAEADGTGPVLFVGDGGDSTVDVRGKVAVVTMSAPPRPKSSAPSKSKSGSSPTPPASATRRPAASPSSPMASPPPSIGPAPLRGSSACSRSTPSPPPPRRPGRP